MYTPPPDAPLAINEYEFISADDIEFESIESLSFSNDDMKFNPGYKNRLYSEIRVTLDTTNKVNLFNDWVTNNLMNANITVDIDWYIYNTFNSSNMLELELETVSNNISILSYDEQSLILDYTNNTSRSSINGTYTIESWYIVYSGQNVDKYSGISICDAFDSSYFKPNTSYTLTNNVTLTYSTQTNNVTETEVITKSASFDMVANWPVNLKTTTCDVTPQYGTALIDIFNFSCIYNINNSNSINNQNYNYNYSFNFVKEDLLRNEFTFLKTFYDEKKYVETRLPSSNSSNSKYYAIILDDLDLATCVEISNITVTTDNLNQISDSTSAENFTNWLNDTFETILSESNNDPDQTLSDIMVVLEATYGLVEDYIDVYSSTNGTSSLFSNNDSSLLIKLQENIILTIVNASSNSGGGIDTESECVVLLSALSKITQVLDIDYTNHNDESQSQSSEIVSYSVGLINSLLSDVMEPTVDTLSNTVEGQLNDDACQNAINVLSNVQAMRQISKISYADYNYDTITTRRMGRRLSDDDNDEQGGETEADAHRNGQIISDSIVLLSQLTLNNSIPGESYQFDTDIIDVKSSKISNVNYDTCNTVNYTDYNSNYNQQQTQIKLSQQYVDIKSNNGESNMDCTVATFTDNIYDNRTIAQAANKWQNNQFVSINVASDTDVVSDSDSDSDSDLWVSRCDPIIISFNTSNNSFWSEFEHLPMCLFYNETTQLYSDNGCYVLEKNSDTGIVKLASLHTTHFGVSYDDFRPEINYASDDYYADLSIENFLKYPLGWVTVLTWILLCLTLIVIIAISKRGVSDDTHDMPLIMERNAIFKDDDKQTESLKLKYRSIKDLRVLSNEKSSYYYKLFGLWRISFRNDHIWFGICCRNHGTSYTYLERTAVMFIRFLTSMAVAG